MSRRKKQISDLDLKKIGGRIAYIRTRKKESIAQFAEKTGLSTGNISALENDKYDPSLSALLKIIESYDVNSEWLLTGEGDPYLYKEGISAEDEEVYLPGKYEEKVIDGQKKRIFVISPDTLIQTVDRRASVVKEAPADSFARAVSSLKDIYEQGDSLTRSALEANLEVFKIAAKLITEYKTMSTRMGDLEAKVAALEQFISEHRPPHETGERRRDWTQIRALLNIKDGHPAEERSKP